MRLYLCGTEPLRSHVPIWYLNEYGTSAGWYWQVKTEGFGEKPVAVLLCPQELSHGLCSEGTRASEMSELRINLLLNLKCVVGKSSHGHSSITFPLRSPSFYACKETLSSSSYSITNLGQGGLFQSQHSRQPVASSLVVQVVVFLLDDTLEVVLGASILWTCWNQLCLYVQTFPSKT
jgi:hypothetical protein